MIKNVAIKSNLDMIIIFVHIIAHFEQIIMILINTQNSLTDFLF